MNMKTTLKKFKNIINEEMRLRLEGVDRVKRSKRGYGDEETFDDYHDVSEDADRLRRAADGYGETEFEEDADRLRRAADGYGETEFEEDIEITLDTDDDEPEEKAKSHATAKDGGDVGGPLGRLSTLAAAYDPLEDDDVKLKKLKDLEELAQLYREDLKESGMPGLSFISEKAPSEKEEEYVKKNLIKYMKRYGQKQGRDRVYKDAARLTPKTEDKMSKADIVDRDELAKKMKDKSEIDEPYALATHMIQKKK